MLSSSPTRVQLYLICYLSHYLYVVPQITSIKLNTVCEKRSITPFVAPEEASNDVSLRLSCIVGNAGGSLWKGGKNVWNKTGDITQVQFAKTEPCRVKSPVALWHNGQSVGLLGVHRRKVVGSNPTRVKLYKQSQ